ncbi:hypothetical protein [Nesterenkonia sp. F]|uniref:hypothetical protein n=1 Tax=Nesterenkonia sp. F TaxID=795955 RepID=UPI001111BB0C|nr:hypothetical protein [Nesterenkonia sp. F]
MTRSFKEFSQTGTRFGTAAYDPSSVETSIEEPPKYSRLKVLTWISFALYALSLSLTAIPALSGSMHEQLVQQYALMGMSEQQIQATADGAVDGALFGVGIGLIAGSGIYLLVYFGLVKRRNWARTVGLIFAILGGIGSLVSAGAGALNPTPINIVGTLVGLTNVAVAVAWIRTAVNAQVREYTTQATWS